MASSAPIHSAVDEHVALHIASAAAATPEALDALGVTHVVNVSVNGPMPQRSTEPQYESMHIAIDDDLSAPLHEHLDAAADFIDAALSSGGRVCVFSANDQCAACAVAAFYLMRQHGRSLAEALGAMQARPNVGFWQRLIEAESWLRAAPPQHEHSEVSLGVLGGEQTGRRSGSALATIRTRTAGGASTGASAQLHPGAEEYIDRAEEHMYSSYSRSFAKRLNASKNHC